MADHIPSTLLHIVIRQKDGVVWEGNADSFSSTNQVGTFDVLPEHSHFVGLIEKYIIIRQDKNEKKWDLDHGLVSIKDNLVEVYLGY